MKSLADLRAEKKPEPRRPECSVTLSLRPDLMARAQSLEAEAEDLVAKSGNQPKRQGSGADPRLTEIRSEIIALYEEIAESSGEMHLRAKPSDGEWRRWCDEHPARDDGDPGHDRDQRVTFGYCNADDLLEPESLGRFAHMWNGEPVTDRDWLELIEPDTWPGDKAQMARRIVEMYEGGSANFLQRRSVLLDNLKRLNDFALRATSGSPTSESTVGSPEPSSEDSTDTENPAP